jgi:predicted trehalose synthase
VATDQTNESVIVAERSVVKWVRRPSSGDQPAMRLLELRAAGGAARRVRRQLAARRVD